MILWFAIDLISIMWLIYVVDMTIACFKVMQAMIVNNVFYMSPAPVDNPELFPKDVLPWFEELEKKSASGKKNPLESYRKWEEEVKTLREARTHPTADERGVLDSTANEWKRSRDW